MPDEHERVSVVVLNRRDDVRKLEPHGVVERGLHERRRFIQEAQLDLRVTKVRARDTRASNVANLVVTSERLLGAT